jgi:hypothetical protein
VLVLAATAAGVTVVQAQATPTPPAQNQTQNPRERFLAALASRLNIPVDRLRQAMQDARNDVGMTRPQGQGQGQHPGGKRGGFSGFPARGLLAEEADAVAPLFGLDRQGLVNELRGKTLAEVAAAHNVPVQNVINTIVQTANARVDRMASQRNLSADQVNQIKQRISQRVPDLVNNHRFQNRPNRQNRTAPTTHS